MHPVDESLLKPFRRKPGSTPTSDNSWVVPFFFVVVLVLCGLSIGETPPKGDTTESDIERYLQ